MTPYPGAVPSAPRPWRGGRPGPPRRALATYLPNIRWDATESSDIDFLVDLESSRGLFDLGGLLMDLRDLLGHEVDVVTEAGLRPRVAERVLADAIEL